MRTVHADDQPSSAVGSDTLPSAPAGSTPSSDEGKGEAVHLRQDARKSFEENLGRQGSIGVAAGGGGLATGGGGPMGVSEEYNPRWVPGRLLQGKTHAVSGMQ